MLSQLCRAQLWPKPSRKWNRRFSRGTRCKLGPGHINAPNIVHFNCSTNNLQGIPDHCSDYGGDSSCCSDEENDCSSGGYDDTCSEYSCSTSMPLDRECCCCCQVAENPAYGLSTLEPRIPPLSAESKISENNVVNHLDQPENEYIPLWNTRQQQSREKTFKIIPPKQAEEGNDTLASQDRVPHGLTMPRIVDSGNTTRLRGMLSERDSPSAFRVVMPKSQKLAASNISKSKCHQNVPINHPLSVRVTQGTPRRRENTELPSHKAQRLRACPTKLKRFSVCDADEILKSASREEPAQVSMVVMQCAKLHLSLSSSPPFQQMSLPMGTLVTALYRDQDWIYVQTPHGVKGFLYHTNCTPLGILPAPTKLEPWETPDGARKRLDDHSIQRIENRNMLHTETGSVKKSNVQLQGRNRENAADRIKYDNKAKRIGSSIAKQAKIAYPSKTNVENVRATLQRNLSSQNPTQDLDKNKAAKKLLEKNIDKLISSTRTAKLNDDCSDMAMQLETLRIENAPTEGRSGMSNV